MAGEDDDGPTTAELREQLDELRGAFEDYREASTARERAAAKDDVDDARADLAKTARALGVSEAQLSESVAAAKKAERRGELEPLIREILDELKDDDDDEPAKAKAKPKAKPKAKADPPDDDDGDELPPDTEPVVEHWLDKPIGALLR